jgi:hypothetical protein
LLDVGRLAKLGWRACTSLVYQAYLSALKQVTDLLLRRQLARGVDFKPETGSPNYLPAPIPLAKSEAAWRSIALHSPFAVSNGAIFKLAHHAASLL